MNNNIKFNNIKINHSGKEISVEDKEISKKDWFTSGEISWEEYWNDPSWEIEKE